MLKVKFCPSCKSDNIDLYAGALTGTYYCKKCGYEGALIIEKDIDERSTGSAE